MGRMNEQPDPQYSVRIVADSVDPSDVRLTTFLVTYQRFIHSELMTHRDFSRNSASSRAIPAKKLQQMVETDPAMPIFWGLERKGMQADEELPEDVRSYVKARWLQARDQMLAVARELSDLGTVCPEWAGLGLHKQLVNRLIEPWMKITVLITATRFDNFFHLRCHRAAMPEIQRLAVLMREARRASVPVKMRNGDWHLPFIRPDDEEELCRPNGGPSGEEHRDHPLVRVSVGRCARLSYLTHDGVRAPAEDIALAARLEHADQPDEPGHWSPFEHQAVVSLTYPPRPSNLDGFWVQNRKLYARENFIQDPA